MNTSSRSTAKTWAARAALSVLGLAGAASPASGQTYVTVANGPGAPVPVTGTITTNPAAQVYNPYQRQGSIGNASSCAPQCVINFEAVPAGYRLVLTNVSAQVGPNIELVVIEGNDVSHFVPKAYPTASYLNAPVTVDFEPGRTPSARFYVQNAMETTSLIVTLAGYLVPVPNLMQ